MILVAQAIINEGAVMIESLHTLVTIVAVHSVLGPQILAVNTDIVKVQLLVNKPFHEAKEVLLERHVPWVNQCQTVE